MKNILQTWIYGFSIMILTGICMFIASLPLRIPAMFFLKANRDSGNSTLLLPVVYIALFLLFVPIVFGWLLDKVLKYSTPRIRNALEKSAFIGQNK